jgi:hypothetical protein
MSSVTMIFATILGQRGVKARKGHGRFSTIPRYVGKFAGVAGVKENIPPDLDAVALAMRRR